jgi:hypothetical protein
MNIAQKPASAGQAQNVDVIANGPGAAAILAAGIGCAMMRDRRER